MLLREKIKRSWKKLTNQFSFTLRREILERETSVMDDLKDSVDFGHKRVDTLEYWKRAENLEAAIKDAKEALEKSLYLETYSRRETFKFAGTKMVLSH